MKNWFGKVINAIRKALLWFVSGDAADAIAKGFEVVAPYIATALELVQVAAALTENRTLDEIVALADKFQVSVVIDPATPAEERGKLIGAIVFAALQQQFPEVAPRRLNRAIESAYGAINP